MHPGEEPSTPAGRKPAAVRLHAVATGYVQGVGFRYFVLHRARARRLSGWVRNRQDGGVECLAEGSRQELEQLLGEIRRGPWPADVRDVEVEWQPARGDLPAEFEVVI
jgi:acylphosphatase